MDPFYSFPVLKALRSLGVRNPRGENTSKVKQASDPLSLESAVVLVVQSKNCDFVSFGPVFIASTQRDVWGSDGWRTVGAQVGTEPPKTECLALAQLSALTSPFCPHR